MSGLTVAAFSALALTTCHLPLTAARVDRDSDYAMTESGGDPLALNLNGPGGGGIHLKTVEDAVALASRLIAAGRSVDLGLMQVNSAHLGESGMPATVAELLEPCANIRAGDAILAAADRQAACIYNTGKPGCANGYPEKILSAAAQRTFSPAPSAAAAAPPQDKPRTWDVWASASATIPEASFDPWAHKPVVIEDVNMKQTLAFRSRALAPRGPRQCAGRRGWCRRRLHVGLPGTSSRTSGPAWRCSPSWRSAA